MHIANPANDLIRLYLTQIGKTPLLSAPEEEALARRIQQARKLLRRQLLSNVFVLRGAVEMLRQVQAGAVRFETVIDASVRDTDVKQRIQTRLLEHLPVLSELLETERIELWRQSDPDKRLDPSALRRLVRRRRQAARIVEQLNIRTERLLERFERVAVISERMCEVHGKLKFARDHSRGRLCSRLLRYQRLAGDSRTGLQMRIRRTRNSIKLLDEARQTLVVANLRLVFSIARRCRADNEGLLDLIQQGNLGLMRAAEKFEAARGHRFSSFATHWVRHAINRALNDQGRTIRLPRNQMRQMKHLNRQSSEFLLTHGRSPTVEERAEASGLTPIQVTGMLHLGKPPVSLQQTSGDGDGLGPELRDESPGIPPDSRYELLKKSVATALHRLSDRERMIIQLRFGFTDEGQHSLAQIGRRFSLSRERIRQIEAETIQSLKENEDLVAVMDDICF